MKVTVSGRFMDAPIEDQCGVVSWASFNRIVRAMVNEGELILRPGEEVVGITIDGQGLAFKIDKKQ